MNLTLTPEHLAISSSLLAYCPSSLTSASFRMIAHICMSCAFFHYLLTPIHFRLFSLQSNCHNFGLLAFLLLSGFPRITFFTVLSSDILSRWPANSSLLIFIVITIFGCLYITHSLSLFQILCLFCTFSGPYVVLSISCSHVLTLRSLTLYIYGAPILDVSRSHTTTQHSR